MVPARCVRKLVMLRVPLLSLALLRVQPIWSWLLLLFESFVRRTLLALLVFFVWRGFRPLALLLLE